MEANAAAHVSRENNKQQRPKNGPRVDSLTKKALTRSIAIDRSDSSGGKHGILTTGQGQGRSLDGLYGWAEGGVAGLGE